MEINEGLLDLLRSQVGTDNRDGYAAALSLYRSLRNQWPQINERTRLTQPADHFGRDIPLESITPHKVLGVEYIPKAGIIPALQRLRAKIHKWLIDNRYHPADRPPNWKPLDIRRIGMVEGYPPVAQWCRTIERQRFGIRMAEHLYLYHPETIIVSYAYDPLTDTLYFD